VCIAYADDDAPTDWPLEKAIINMFKE
jgi:hypothetical protein